MYKEIIETNIKRYYIKVKKKKLKNQYEKINNKKIIMILF